MKELSRMIDAGEVSQERTLGYLKPKSRLENLREFYRNPTTPLGKILVEAMPLSGEIGEPERQQSKPPT